MSITRIAAGVLLLGSFALVSCARADAAASITPQQLLDQMSARFASVRDYEVTVDATSRSDSHRYKFAFKKPGMIRLRTLTGEDKDGEMCVRPDGAIRGRKNSGLLKAFAITMNRSDKRLKDAEGVGVWEMDFISLVTRLKAKVHTPGIQATIAAPSQAGGAYQLTLRYSSGKLAGAVDNYWIDSQTFFFTKTERFTNNSLSERRVFSGLRVNPGFTDGYFEF